MSIINSFFTFCIIILTTHLFTSVAVNGQITLPGFSTTSTTTTTTNPDCLCNTTCEGTWDKLNENFAFTVNVFSSRFSRYTFRRAVGRRLVNNQYALIDKEVTPDTYTFGFRPSDAQKLSSQQVCDSLDPSFLATQYSCCLRNQTTEAPTLSPEEIAANEAASHRTQLIICWISIAGATVYLVYITKKNSTQKDSVLETALDLATQKDEDEL